jgi:hypothetical protein
MKARVVPLGGGLSLWLAWSPDEPQPNDAFQGWIGSFVRTLERACVPGRIDAAKLEDKGVSCFSFWAIRRGSEVEVGGNVVSLELEWVHVIRLFRTYTLDELRVEIGLERTHA